MHPSDRREFQRLKLSKPILGTLGSANALVLDIGIAGAFVEHYGTAVPGDRITLTFRWQGEDVAFECEVVRSNVVKTPAGDGESVLSQSGLRFHKPIGDSADKLQELIASFVGRILAAQKANAAGEGGGRSAGETILATIGQARRSRSHGYLSYRFKDNHWWRIPTESAVQPIDGFTVGTHEDEEEIETLCRAYEAADDEGKRLIRLVAELSTARG
ncbi:MAG TPA: PilZ domain-containing protein [Thermoanaerobaculia bacterium]|nr:PilZ domain-containing protein [Thermoanaerobaculia bacterium]